MSFHRRVCVSSVFRVFVVVVLLVAVLVPFVEKIVPSVALHSIVVFFFLLESRFACCRHVLFQGKQEHTQRERERGTHKQRETELSTVVLPTYWSIPFHLLWTNGCADGDGVVVGYQWRRLPLFFSFLE